MNSIDRRSEMHVLHSNTEPFDHQLLALDQRGENVLGILNRSTVNMKHFFQTRNSHVIDAPHSCDIFAL